VGRIFADGPRSTKPKVAVREVIRKHRKHNALSSSGGTAAQHGSARI